MPTVKLLKPRSVQIGGVIYQKGVVTPVDEDTARALDEDARFVVEGLDGRRQKKSPAVHAKSVATKIREAADQLDPDVESNFTADGRPSAEAISKALGETISQHKVDVALGLGGKGRVVVKEPPRPAPPPAAPRIKKVKLTPKKPDTPATGGNTNEATTNGGEDTGG
jgi:hypothetical protein